MALSKKEQKIFSILDKDESQRNYFFRKVKDIKWFQPLLKEGFFDINRYPIRDTSVTEQGQIIAWIQLLYIEELLNQFKESLYDSYLSSIIGIIKNIINSEYNNYWVDYKISKILSLIPQDKIEYDLLEKHFGNLENNADTRPIDDHIIIEELLPNVLKSGNPDKINLVVKSIFEFRSYKDSMFGSVVKTKYNSSDLKYSITKEFLFKFEIEELQLFLDKLLLILIPQMRSLADGSEFQFKIEEQEYKLTINYTDLFNFNISISGEKNINFSISEFNKKTPKELSEEITGNLSWLDLSKIKLDGFIEESESNIFAPFRRLYQEDYYSSSFRFIKQGNGLGGNDITDLLHILVRLFELIYEKNELDSNKLIEDLMNSSKYYLPFFKRASISFINKNYDKHRNVFWDNIEKYNFLSDYKYDDDAFDLINNNKEHLSEEEILILAKLIEVGPVTENRDNYSEFKKYWQFKWYSLLKGLEVYEDKYEKLKPINKGKDFVWRPSGVSSISGVKSPVKQEELAQMTVPETVNYLNKYEKDKDDFLGPDEEGLAEALEKAVKDNPTKYIKEINLFQSAQNTYIYALTNSLESIISKEYSEYIDKILVFYINYISSPDFEFEKKEKEDEFRHKSGEYTVRMLLRLLKKIVSDDKIVIQEVSFKKLGKLAEIIHSFIKPEYYSNDSNKYGYIMFAINNPEGMFYEFLLELSLREGRQSNYQNETWQYKSYFEDAIKNDNDSAITILGQYISNFMWLNNDWSIEKVKALQIGSDSWQAFFGGYLPMQPIKNKIGFEILKPSYVYLINHNINYSISGGYGLGNHLFILYYNNIIDLSKGNLIDLYYSHVNNNKGELTNAITKYEGHLTYLQGKEKNKLETKLTELIIFVTHNLSNSKEEKDLEALYSLFRLIPLFDNLNKKVINSLVSITEKHTQKSPRFFLHTLVKYIEENDTKEYANMLLDIYKNLYTHMINTFRSSYTIEIWDFIMSKADIDSNKKIILKISKEYIRNGDDRLQEYFMKIAEKVKK